MCGTDVNLHEVEVVHAGDTATSLSVSLSKATFL